MNQTIFVANDQSSLSFEENVLTVDYDGISSPVVFDLLNTDFQVIDNRFELIILDSSNRVDFHKNDAFPNTTFNTYRLQKDYILSYVESLNNKDLQSLINLSNTQGLGGQSGYSRTSAFAGKPVASNYIWLNKEGILYTAQDVANKTFKVFSLDEVVHAAVDNPYWTTPAPSGLPNIGLFQGANLPEGVTSLFDYSYDYDANYPSSEGTGFEGSTGRIRLNDLQYGDQLRVRFDFNVIPQVANTTVEAAIWYSNRDDNDVITYTSPLTTQPSFYGGGSTVGNVFLNRPEISAWITSNEDVNALALPAIKSDNPVIIQPLGLLVTIIR
jgi:hypothetical protein